MSYLSLGRFFQCLQMLVGCGLSGPTSPLAFGEAVLGAMGRSAGSLQNKEQLWRMWSVMVSQLTDTISQVGGRADAAMSMRVLSVEKENIHVDSGRMNEHECEH